MHTVFTKNQSQLVLDRFFSLDLKGRTKTIWTWELPKPATVVQLQPELVWSSCGLLPVTQLDFQTLPTAAPVSFANIQNSRYEISGQCPCRI